jgi:hypothetical protein
VKRANKELDDAKLAAKLQAQENSKARPTRGGATKKATPRKKAPRKKSEKKVKAEDDSDIELDENGEIKEKPKKGGFHVGLCLDGGIKALTTCRNSTFSLRRWQIWLASQR